MFPNVPPAKAIGVNEKSYAARCVAGDIQAGMQLVRLLWAKGTKDVTIGDLLEIAFPMRDAFTLDGFDNLADSLAEAIRHREFHKVMKEGGIPDRDITIDIGDLAMGD